ncbi:hypothetical protein [Neisseria cinerea]|nr:hypothetical protein [Neisseria cinerea]
MQVSVPVYRLNCTNDIGGQAAPAHRIDAGTLARQQPVRMGRT